MFRIRADLGKRDLVGTKGSFDFLSIHRLRAGPTLGSAEHDHRPNRPLGKTLGPRSILNAMDFLDDSVQGPRQELMYGGGFRSFNEIRPIAVAGE